MDSVIIYRNCLEMMNVLLTNDKDWREAMTGLLEFGFEGVMPKTENPLIQSVYRASIPQIKRSRERYIRKCEEALDY